MIFLSIQNKQHLHAKHLINSNAMMPYAQSSELQRYFAAMGLNLPTNHFNSAYHLHAWAGTLDELMLFRLKETHKFDFIVELNPDKAVLLVLNNWKWFKDNSKAYKRAKPTPQTQNTIDTNKLFEVPDNTTERKLETYEDMLALADCKVHSQ
ncbi:hypothetical protein V5T82_14150 [Magnetovibrio sp. PR-2]|uniref:hypothetical protein n=1 Tax=Magnetovibrio sp. PR-2 TaxID=3120356 RepID=UPI002FCE1C09